ncbi:MAG: 3-deoxy-manno-octulosonate cytidylyltransferase [Aminobacterium sp.]|jgi:3-deoxy-manno-octulosonate cytidylyltransferase (CMP-KDO synthetase)|uniref:3-deoxy-manno-octulosonate cytidylyltransferase n=1 Tax=Aminobacterium sp. TaxID=1872491 RepID=UPI001BD06E63|nr:3-deoxy-manno-octulosonate cytidylyltransferase [Aminobacterium sp.]MEA4876504.1 3-deoxy-manno-octulosonate cytidylyltransferase [Aminobacterium sp.]
MNILGVIPARYGSTRLPGKPLADICGKPLIQHVYEKAQCSSFLGAVIVATDDERIIEAVQAFNGNAVLTSKEHPNGTCRVAEVAENMNVDYVINIQGDEPLLDPRMIDEVALALTENEDIVSATLCAPLCDEADLSNPNVVKVVRDCRGFALYFSRSPIPYFRVKTSLPVYEHIGIYGYRKDFLMKYVKLEATPLSTAESLEQLKILEHGYSMKVVETAVSHRGPSVDTLEDLNAVRRILG